MTEVPDLGDEMRFVESQERNVRDALAVGNHDVRVKMISEAAGVVGDYVSQFEHPMTNVELKQVANLLKETENESNVAQALEILEKVKGVIRQEMVRKPDGEGEGAEADSEGDSELLSERKEEASENVKEVSKFMTTPPEEAKKEEEKPEEKPSLKRPD